MPSSRQSTSRTGQATRSADSRRACSSGSAWQWRFSALRSWSSSTSRRPRSIPVGRADVRTIVRRAADAGSTIFLNSHLLTEVERVCDRVAIVDHGRVLASGRIDDLLGESSVRVRVTDLAAADVAELRRFGRVAAGEDGWLTVGGIDPERVPDLVAAIVGAGGRVHAVESGRATLEDLFMRLVGRRLACRRGGRRRAAA